MGLIRQETVNFSEGGLTVTILVSGASLSTAFDREDILKRLSGKAGRYGDWLALFSDAMAQSQVEGLGADWPGVTADDDALLDAFGLFVRLPTRLVGLWTDAMNRVNAAPTAPDYQQAQSEDDEVNARKSPKSGGKNIASAKPSSDA